jgi:hypothetical protein
MEKKICPILSKYIWENAEVTDKGLHNVKCKEEKCAWFNEDTLECAILTVSHTGYYYQQRL